jgi:hypothetical protein
MTKALVTTALNVSRQARADVFTDVVTGARTRLWIRSAGAGAGVFAVTKPVRGPETPLTGDLRSSIRVACRFFVVGPGRCSPP